MRFCVQGRHLYRAPFQTLPLTHMLIQALGSSRSLAATAGNLGDFFSSGVLRCFRSPVRLINPMDSVNDK